LIAIPLLLQADDIPLLRGQVLGAAGEDFRGLFVAMEDTVNRVDFHRVDIGLDGTFQFRSVPPGEYLIRITNTGGQTISQQYVTVHAHLNELSVRLPEPQRRPSAPGTVSFTQLSHPPAKKAVQAFSTATRLSSTGKYQEAVAELEKAIRISPEFASAYTNLAVQYIRLNRFEESAAESERALQIGGPDALNLCNLAYAQFQLHRFADAENSARAALHLDPSYLQADLVLGSLLAANPATRTEAIQHLERAVERYPSARRNLELLRGTQ
jgi:tetratricopeptide (TPR) repeat protein